MGNTVGHTEVTRTKAGGVRLRGVFVSLDSAVGKAFIADCAATPKV